MSDVICEVDWDDCEYVSVDVDGEEDVICFDGKEGFDGWYLIIVFDCNIVGFCDIIMWDDGFYDSCDVVFFGGFNFVFEWMGNNYLGLDIEYLDYIQVLMDGENELMC